MKTVSIIIAIIIISIILFFKKDVTIEASQEYRVFNEKLEPINAKVFINRETIEKEPTKELIIYFEELKKTNFLTIAIPPKLIGYPEKKQDMKVTNNTLKMNRECLKFTPINTGSDIFINKYSVTDSIISFNTFNDLTQYGKMIILKK